MWGEQWVCPCAWSNITLRSKCRNCGNPRPDDARIEGHGEIMANVEQRNLADAIAQKTREIEAAGFATWGYRTPEEIDAAPDDPAQV